jgi:hypothetical protein
MKKVCFALTLLALVLALSPAFAVDRVDRGINLVNAMEIDRAGNTFGGTSLTNNGRPLAIGSHFEPGFLQNTGSRPVVLAFSNGKVLKLEAGEAALVDATATPVLQCVCFCGTDIFTFTDTTQAACTAHNGQRCLKKDGTAGWLGGCGMTWVQSTDSAPEP